MSSIKYLLYKTCILLLSLFLVATSTFFLMKAVPGDPFSQDQTIPEEIMKSLMAHYELDQPLHIQYVKYMKGLLHFDLGPSFKYEGRMIHDIIKEGFPISMALGLFAFVIATTCGILFGTIAAIFRGKWQDHLFMAVAVVGMSIPSFIMATLLQYLFAMQLNLLPIARWGDFSHMILPALSLAAFPTAFIARLVRSNMVEVLGQEYIIVAKAKGLSMFKIIRRHVLKNSILPVLSYLGPLSASILTGSFVVEKIFGIPGLGGWFVMSISNRDYTMIMGVTLFYSTLLMIAVFAIDLLSLWINPRLKEDL